MLLQQTTYVRWMVIDPEDDSEQSGNPLNSPRCIP